MKIAANRTRPKPFPRYVDLALTLVCILLWPAFLQAERAEGQNHVISPPPVVSNEISDPVSTRLSGNYSSRLIAAQQQTERKSPLKDESRDLSTFFYIGIGINIILALVFSWWFTREWRKTGNSRRSENVD